MHASVHRWIFLINIVFLFIQLLITIPVGMGVLVPRDPVVMQLAQIEHLVVQWYCILEQIRVGDFDAAGVDLAIA